MKGYKHNQWLKDGMKLSRKTFKNFWNKKTRKLAKIIIDSYIDNIGSAYKKIKGIKEFEMVS